MNTLTVVFLGVLQGFTEFLPVSSSGHLVLAQTFITNFSQPGVLFDVFLHAGTMLAVIVYFAKRIKKIDVNYLFLLAIGTLPAVLVGLIFSYQIENLFQSTKVVGMALILTGIFNFLTDKQNVSSEKLGYKTSFLVGLGQALAIIPGISRSGTTIFTASKLGIKKSTAAEFSFLLSIPAVVGANLLQILKHSGEANIGYFEYLVGFVAAAISGYFAIYFVINLLVTKKFKFFGIYCLVLGVIVLVF